jgi:glycosyltransferase involved in cell wall biosynthesis
MLSGSGSTPTYIEILAPKLNAEGYVLQVASSKTNFLLRFMDMLNCIRKNKDAGVVLIDTYSTKAFYYAWASALLSKKIGIKYIPILHGGNLPERFVNSPAMCRQVFSNSYMNIAVSPYLQKILQQYNYKNELIPNCIDLSLYPFKKRDAFTLRLLWVRAFHKTYNPEMAVRVLELLHKKYPAIHLTMVGPEKDGSLEHCKKLAEELQLSNHISFTGKLTKQEWISLSTEHNIFINTADFDNTPVSLLEGMALGMPVVSTNVGGIPFLVTDKVNGMLVGKGNFHEMAQAVEYIMDHTETAAMLASNARKKVEAYDWDIVKDQWNSLLESV